MTNENETIARGDLRLAIDRIQSIASLGIESQHDTGGACSLIEDECIRIIQEFALEDALQGREPDAEQPVAAELQQPGSDQAGRAEDICNTVSALRESGTQAATDLADAIASGNETEFTVPQILGKRRPDQDPWTNKASMAADRDAHHLHDAEGNLAHANALLETLRHALRSGEYENDTAAELVTESILEHLREAQANIDRHGMAHTNLFLAYFDRERQGGGE